MTPKTALAAFSSGKENAGEKKKRYWITPPELLRELNNEFRFTTDPCPHPKPDNFDGLVDEWGKSNFVNPPFANKQGKKGGMTAWVRKGISEHQKGKSVVFLLPVHVYIHELIKAGANFRALGRVSFLAVEDGTKQPGPHCLMLAILNKETPPEGRPPT